MPRRPRPWPDFIPPRGIEPRPACEGKPTGLFFPHGSDVLAIERAKAVCGGCPYRVRCRDWALSQPRDKQSGLYGVWGGLSEQDRRDIHKQHKKGIAA